MIRTCFMTLAALAMCLAATGCGYANEGLDPPDIVIGPVAPLQLTIVNTAEHDVFLDWSDTHAHFVLTRSGDALILDRGCLPICGEACACEPCPPTSPSARRIAAGASLSFTWTAVHFVEHACKQGEECRCVDSWPLTAGKYEVVVSAYATVEGGAPSSDDPDLWVGASVQAQSPACVARASFSLAPSTQVLAPLDCDL